MVAIRSLADGKVRVAMIPGIAHATELNKATKARPSRPAIPITRSIRNAARERYPLPSSSAIMRNSRAICGMNATTAPTPAKIPSPINDPNQSIGIMSLATPPNHTKKFSKASLMGAATVKMIWKNAYIVAKNTNVPHNGCSNTRSMPWLRSSTSGAR